ncbi:acyltransferase family protein [Pelagibaculum spongiae]|uniref:Acyltransferase n=1 Tax=Pelagibaculum spongiae TaxID=2080658 RepID=A0A2V1H0W3_9GAMM|nr:acyltransferase family protein [Pelagibaculum spongiae]PVZ71600.1 hypothetical protein DC094_00740 [Pelagibaculum spongiae]
MLENRFPPDYNLQQMIDSIFNTPRYFLTHHAIENIWHDIFCTPLFLKGKRPSHCTTYHNDTEDLLHNKIYFPHIDGLRAIAVMAVIIFHFNEGLLPGGYLGVDVFFVISGFVITNYLNNTRWNNTKSFLVDFYLKRFKRIFPALVVCTLVTCAAIAIFVTRPEKLIFKTAAMSIIGMTNNYLYWKSSDYFSLDSSLNPFTHMWSLGVEEQFYLIYPALLIFSGLVLGTRKKLSRYRTTLLLILMVASFVGYEITQITDKSASFYLLPFRLWELGVGCLAYYTYINKNKGMRIFENPLTSWVALFGLTACLYFPEEYQAFTTPLIVITSALIILSDCHSKTIVSKLLSCSPMVWVGLLSYSLYIWHWPILVLGKHTLGLQGKTAPAIIVLILFFSISSYYLVERPLRNIKYSFSLKKQLSLYVTLMVLAALSISSYAPRFSKNYNNIIADLYEIEPVIPWGDDVDCHGELDLSQKKDPVKECLEPTRNNDKPKAFYLIGDSHAAQFYFMANKALAKTSYQVRFINDGSIDGIINRNEKSKSMQYIVENIKPGDVVALAFHRGRLNNSRDKHIPLQEIVKENKKSLAFKRHYLEFQNKITNAGGVSLLLRDTPLMATIATSPSCKLQVEYLGSSVCNVSALQDRHTRRRQDMVYNELNKKHSNTCTWDPLNVMYGNNTSIDVTDKNGEYIMWDWNHITKQTSLDLSKNFLPAFQKCINKIQIATKPSQEPVTPETKVI